MSFSFPNKNSNSFSFSNKNSASFSFPNKGSARSKFFSSTFYPFQDDAPFLEDEIVLETNWNSPNKS